MFITNRQLKGKNNALSGSKSKDTGENLHGSKRHRQTAGHELMTDALLQDVDDGRSVEEAQEQKVNLLAMTNEDTVVALYTCGRQSTSSSTGCFGA